MPVTRAIDVVADANIALKWFHAEGEEEVEQARVLLAAHEQRAVALSVLDLTAYELGNALIRGPAAATADQVATVLESLDAVCPAVRPTTQELRDATALAEQHNLTLYDAAYAAVAASRRATLVTLDAALVEARLGRRPSEIAAELTASERSS
jgi:predicted nucleic acid-binding protein